MLEKLTERLERSFQVLKGEGRISEINVSETMKEVRKALLDADVSYKVAKQFCDDVKEKAMGQNVIKAVKPRELLVKIFRDELVALMGGDAAPLNLTGNPAVILMSGLQGSGKTTFTAKLASKLKSKGRRPLLVAADVYRPAAIDQLKSLGDTNGLPVFTEEGEKDPVKIARDAIEEARARHLDLVIVDTAGRLAVDEEMMDEIENIKNAINPQETLFVVDAMTGQDAVNTAKEFNDRLDFDGVILTKLDGDTRGGAALSIRTVVKKPIKYIGTGEKMGDLQEFNPEGMANRILGMGDLTELANRVQEIYDAKEAELIEKKLRTNQFNLDDFLKQIEKIKKMGNLKDLASMIPGVGKVVKDLDIDNNASKGIEAIIHSMTPYERQNPRIINASRRQRIAKGSGTSVQEVNRFLKQFEETSKMMRMVSGVKNPREMMKKMKARAQRGRR